MSRGRLGREVSRYSMQVHAPEVASDARLRVLRENRLRPASGDGLAALRLRARPRLAPHRLFALLGVRT